MRNYILGCIAMTVSALVVSEAQADCLRELKLPGTVDTRSTVQRSFTLSRPGAVINVMTDSMKDSLAIRVQRPRGGSACTPRGAPSNWTCAPAINRKRNEGVHKIYITNRLRRAVTYTVSCYNPP